MVDLKELQKEIDILLSEETEDTLLCWYNDLMNKKSSLENLKKEMEKAGDRFDERLADKLV